MAIDNFGIDDKKDSYCKYFKEDNYCLLTNEECNVAMFLRSKCGLLKKNSK